MNKTGMAGKKASKARNKKDPYGNDKTTGMSGPNTAGPKGYTYKRKAGGKVGMSGHNRLY